MTLFDPGPRLDEYGPPEPPLSYGRRLTLRQHATIERGRHPATGRALLDPAWGRTCGSCIHHVVHSRGRDRRWHKCRKAGISFGPATDIRISWPACELYTEEATCPTSR